MKMEVIISYGVGWKPSITIESKKYNFELVLKDVSYQLLNWLSLLKCAQNNAYHSIPISDGWTLQTTGEKFVFEFVEETNGISFTLTISREDGLAMTEEVCRLLRSY